MKTQYLPLLVLFLLISIESCKKVNGLGNNSITSDTTKWMETKLVMYDDNSNVKLYDTTYLKPFTSYDYAQFKNGTFINGVDHYYFVNLPGQANATQQITPQVTAWPFTTISTPSGTIYVLNTQAYNENPGGFTKLDTIRLLNANTLWLHSVYYQVSPADVLVSDAYFSK